MKLQIIFVLNKFLLRVCALPPLPQKHMKFKPLYKFCNILIPGRAEQKNLRAGPEISARLTPLL